MIFLLSFKKISRNIKHKLFSRYIRFLIIYSFPDLLYFWFDRIKKTRILASFLLAKDMIISLVTFSLHKDSSVDRVEIGS